MPAPTITRSVSASVDGQPIVGPVVEVPSLYASTASRAGPDRCLNSVSACA